jgi:cytochrome c peroxidase
VSAALLVLVARLAGCAAAPEGWTESERAVILAMSPIPAPPARPTNAVADDPRAAALGARLFFDTGLSRSGTVACSTCHDPARRFTDGKRVAAALGTGTRNTPTIESAAWQTWYFWDGRADSAWAQATGPLTHPDEHGLDAAGVRARVAEAHAEAYAAVFGPLPDDAERVLVEVGKALEAYERTLRPPEAPLDRYVADLRAGRASAALTPAQEEGLRVFLRSGCANCHHGPWLTDHQFHNLGLPSRTTVGIDPGRARGAALVKQDPRNCAGTWADRTPGSADDGDPPCPELQYLDPSFPDWPSAFKTPTLRGVGATAPYMHDGQLGSLGAVVTFYDALPGSALVGHRETILRPLGLGADARASLEAFLAGAL